MTIKPCQSPEQTIYTLDWAYSIYKRFAESFACETRFINRLYNIGPLDPAFWLATRSDRWNNYKKVVKLWKNQSRCIEKSLTCEELLNKSEVLLFKKNIKKRFSPPEVGSDQLTLF